MQITDQGPAASASNQILARLWRGKAVGSSQLQSRASLIIRTALMWIVDQNHAQKSRASQPCVVWSAAARLS